MMTISVAPRAGTDTGAVQEEQNWWRWTTEPSTPSSTSEVTRKLDWGLAADRRFSP